MITKEVKIKRLYFKDTYTIGKCTVDGEYISDTIEDKVRVLNSIEDKVWSVKRLYQQVNMMLIYTSVRNLDTKVIRLFNVPYFEGIYVHKGNTAKDSHGCLIVGFNDKKGWVSRPTEALNKLIKAVEGADEIKVIIE